MTFLRNVLLGFLISSQAFAGLPPTTAKGVSDTSPSVTFNLQAPNSQVTRVNATTGLIETGNQNVIINPNASGGTAGYTASGGTFTTGGTGTKTYFSWDSSAASQTVASGYQTITTSDPWSSRGGVVSANFQCAASSSCTHVLRVYDGTNVLASQSIATGNETNPKFSRTSVNFIYPESGTVRWEIASVASNEPTVLFRGLYMGLAEGFNTFTAQGGITGPWTNYTPTISGCGVATISYAQWRQVGESDEIRTTFTCTTAGASVLKVSLPTSHVANQTFDTVLTGSFITNYTGGTQAGMVPLLIASDTSNIQVGRNNSASGFAPLASNAIAINGSVASLTATVPIVGYTANYANTAVTPDQGAATWAGFHTGNWTQTTSGSAFTYSDFSTGNSPVLTTRGTPRNISCVTHATSAIPGITCQLPRADLYQVCASSSVTLTATTNNMLMRLTDSSGTVIANSPYIAESGAGSRVPFTLCGQYQQSAVGAQSFKLQGASDATSQAMTLGLGTTQQTIEWSISALTQAVGPVIVGPVYTLQKFTSGTSQTYTTPAGVRAIRVRMVGGGGGGGEQVSGSAGTAGGDGGNTTFGTSLLVANGGKGGTTTGTPAAGGTASLGSGPVGTALSGGTGGQSFRWQSATAEGSQGGNGAASPFGGAGAGAMKTSASVIGTSSPGAANSGSGGGGAPCTGSGGNCNGYMGGGGGGAGGFVDALISSPLATYSYTVGAGGTSTNGGAGGSGYIEVTEYYGAMPAPAANSVTTSASAAKRLETASITASCTASPCTVDAASTSWLTNITRSGTGLYTANFVTGYFTSAPTCWCQGSDSRVCTANTLPTTTGWDFNGRNTADGVNDDVASLGDLGASMIFCLGSH